MRYQSFGLDIVCIDQVLIGLVRFGKGLDKVWIGLGQLCIGCIDVRLVGIYEVANINMNMFVYFSHFYERLLWVTFFQVNYLQEYFLLDRNFCMYNCLGLKVNWIIFIGFTFVKPVQSDTVLHNPFVVVYASSFPKSA